MVLAPKTGVVQCHCGKKLSREGWDNGRKGKMGRKSCCSQCETGKDTELGGGGGVLAGA